MCLMPACLKKPLLRIRNWFNSSPILRRGGWLGGLLAIAEASERPPGSDLGKQLEAVLLAPAGYAQAVVHACGWAIQVSRQK